MAILNLPDASSDRVVNVTIPKEYDSYFVDWYQDTKKDGETPEQFALRLLGVQALYNYRNKRVGELSQINSATADGAVDEVKQFITDNNLD